ncbi:DUF2339 domain-containing protein [Phycicoccus endophyticus]|uniref:DUF2339 domain-containing protein n=1 Tax=Phycicoccus endophyticus TaxID=1690220 RepID=A0A7G9R258_9MICO|nr:DUF2339 domain-containing protein [Phycicoccus endophyticus]QNN49683.1 DUF2339 domain-containing protein [Phycicoccus endophyticus]
MSAGALLAVLLGGLGVRGGARDRSTGGPVGSAPVALVATGAAAAYLDVVAATTAYGWLPAVPGLVLCLVVAVAGLAVARRWASELLAVLMVAGAGSLAPVVVGRPGWLLSAVLGILALVGWWAGAGRRAPWLTVTRTVPVALSLLAGAGVGSGATEHRALLLVALLVLGTTLATSAVSVRGDADDLAASAALALVTVGTLAVGSAQPGSTRTLAYAVIAVVLLLAAAALSRPPAGPVAGHLVVSVATGGAVAAVLAVLDGAPRGFAGTGLLALALGHLAVAAGSRSRVALGLGAGVSAVALLGWLGHPVAMVSAELATHHDLAVAALDSVLAAGVVAVGWWAASRATELPVETRRVATVIGWVVGLASTATVLVSISTLVGERLGGPGTGFTTGHALATVTWVGAAAGLLLHSLARPSTSDLALRSGLLLSAVAVTKLFLFDLAALDGVVRSVAFIAAGLLLLATGSRYARAWERVRTRT